jgi:hypothetical protein
MSGRGTVSDQLGDLIAVIDGRDELISECLQGAAELRCFLRENTRALLATRAFHDALPGYLPGDVASQALLRDLLAKPHTLRTWSKEKWHSTIST